MRLVFLALLFFRALYSAPLDVSVRARSAIVVNAETGAVLYEKEACALSFPASTTKIATALYILDEKKANLEQMVTASREALRHKPPGAADETPAYYLSDDGSTMHLLVGERLSIKSLLHGLLLISGNDAANVLAEAVSGSVPQFMEELNKYLLKLGCEHTHFSNPHGYHHPDHVTSAADLARLTQKALTHPIFRELVSKQAYQKPKTNKQPASEILQWNGLIREGKHRYSKAIGVKTGFHSQAQHCLVSAASDQGRTLIAVLLGCPSSQDRYEDARALFEAAFAQKKMQRILAPTGQLYSKALKGAKTKLLALLTQPLAISFYPAEEPQVKAFIHWDEFSLPIRKGQRVGEIRAIDERGAVLAREELLAQDDIRRTFFSVLKQWVGM